MFLFFTFEVGVEGLLQAVGAPQEHHQAEGVGHDADAADDGDDDGVTHYLPVLDGLSSRQVLQGMEGPGGSSQGVDGHVEGGGGGHGGSGGDTMCRVSWRY